jgi:hypothetical protein
VASEQRICSACGTVVLAPDWEKHQVLHQRPQVASAPPRATSAAALGRPVNRDFRAFKLVAAAIKVVAVVGFVLAAVVGLDGGMDESLTPLQILVIVCGGFVQAVVMFAFANVIDVLLAIEENTRRG